ncbi:PLP-dependent aminotransferase family protein [Ensifer sp. ENS04]|uniref:aminotransferase-like domain-containing protein n=1 Tax=Ensifer sp. ENS04 TaxID=2769281 RepID=UPI0017831127|nr:PLP-dependent aminotransferase family protein [Ensifer sp. ENS04]MBD9541470.1 PLP-dependent aminotransferase family protein [Ensifer sp. ENS04]
MGREDFSAIADRIANDIATGRLKPGERLQPQRNFAYAHGIAVSTASRVYQELARRGLTAGEVGRGTYVRSTPAPVSTPLVDPTSAPIDLELIFPVLPEHHSIFARTISEMTVSPAFADALRPMGASVTIQTRQTAARFLERPDWAVDPEGILFAGNGRQAISAALSAIARPGDRIGVEALTHPLAKTIAERLGVTLVPIDIDAEGIVPESLAGVHRATPLSAIYLQPSLHSPTGATMSLARREAVARVLIEQELIAVEDGVYEFLVDDRPLASLAPENVVFVSSLSKRIAPGLTLGLIAAPPRFACKIAGALRGGALYPSAFNIAAGLRWMTHAEGEQIVEAKRSDALTRQKLARKILPPDLVTGDSRAYHLWLTLPHHWRAEAFSAAALSQGIALTPGSAFGVTPGHAPNGVRIALAAPPLRHLIDAVRKLRAILNQSPADVIRYRSLVLAG